MKVVPWYKQFWPWFLISLPVISIVACAGLIYIAVNKGPDMVVDDYYKKGKAINLELSKYDKAKALYLHGELKIIGDRVSFRFTKGDYKNTPSLKLSFYHRTIKALDRSLMLTANASGEYTALTEDLAKGSYTVFIEPFDGLWKLKENIALPNEQAIAVSPQYK